MFVLVRTSADVLTVPLVNSGILNDHNSGAAVMPNQCGGSLYGMKLLCEGGETWKCRAKSISGYYCNRLLLRNKTAVSTCTGSKIMPSGGMDNKLPQFDYQEFSDIFNALNVLLPDPQKIIVCPSLRVEVKHYGIR